MGEYKLITGITAGDRALKAIETLHAQGVYTANRYPARGASALSGYHYKGVDILTVLIEADRAEAVFEQLYHLLGIDGPGGGLIYQEAIGRASRFVLESQSAPDPSE
jgi:hypothetical protein